jgi:hypothetical protein
MAGTNDDPNIWRLLADEYAFIAGLAKSEKLADELVRSFLEEGEIDRDGRVRYRIWQVRALPGGAPSPYDGAFWQSDPERGIHCEIDHRNSSAHWTGPASAEWKASGRKTAEYQVVMIRLNHSVVLDFLMGVGLLPLAEQPAFKSEQPQIVGSLVVAESSDAATVAGAIKCPAAEPIRSPTEWIEYAIEQNREQLIGMSVRAASKELAKWMGDGRYSPRKPIGWSRIKTIATDTDLLPIKRSR